MSENDSVDSQSDFICNFFDSADVVVICFSICDRESLKHVEWWNREARKHCNKGTPMVLCACQIDERYHRRIPEYLQIKKDLGYE